MMRLPSGPAEIVRSDVGALGGVPAVTAGSAADAGVRGGRRTVEEPSIIREEAPGGREKVVPETTTAGPPGVRVWPDTTRSGPGFEASLLPGTGVNVAPLIVIGEPEPEPEPATGVGAGRGTVEPPIMIEGGRPPPLLPEPGRERVVPDTTTGGPPGVKVWLPTTRPEPEGVSAMPDTVTTDGGEPPLLSGAAGDPGDGRLMVEEPITTAVALGARETGVPEIITAGAPGVMVFVPMISVELCITAVAEPTTRGAGAGVGPGVMAGLGAGLAGLSGCGFFPGSEPDTGSLPPEGSPSLDGSPTDKGEGSGDGSGEGLLGGDPPLTGLGFDGGSGDGEGSGLEPSVPTGEGLNMLCEG